MPTEWEGPPGEEVSPPPGYVMAWILTACVTMTGSAVLTAWALAHQKWTGVAMLLGATLAAAGVLLLGIDHAETIEHEESTRDD